MRNPIPNFSRHLLVAVAGVVFAVGCAIVLLAGSGAIGGTDTREVRALIPSSSALAAQARVTMAGVRVGRVTHVRRRGGMALVTMQVDRGQGRIPADSRVALRLRTLVGEKSLEIVPGASPRGLPDGGLLPASQADDLVEVDQILTQLRGRTRQQARAAIQALGKGLDGKGRQLNDLVAAGSGIVNVGTDPFVMLSRNSEEVTKLVSNVAELAQRVGDRGRAIRGFADGLNRTFRAIAGRDQALRASLDAMPSTIDALRRTSGILDRTATVASPTVARATTAVTGLHPAVRTLRPAAQHGRELVRELDRINQPLRTTLASARALSPDAVSALPKLGRTLCQLNPLVRYLAPYDRELTSMVASLGSAVNSYDANGHIARLYIGVGDSSVFGLLPPEVEKAKSDLINSGILQQLRMLGYNPYPAPGKANETKIGRNSTGPADAENAYVRVNADC